MAWEWLRSSKKIDKLEYVSIPNFLIIFYFIFLFARPILALQGTCLNPNPNPKANLISCELTKKINGIGDCSHVPKSQRICEPEVGDEGDLWAGFRACGMKIVNLYDSAVYATAFLIEKTVDIVDDPGALYNEKLKEDRQKQMKNQMQYYFFEENYCQKNQCIIKDVPCQAWFRTSLGEEWQVQGKKFDRSKVSFGEVRQKNQQCENIRSQFIEENHPIQFNLSPEQVASAMKALSLLIYEQLQNQGGCYKPKYQAIRFCESAGVAATLPIVKAVLAKAVKGILPEEIVAEIRHKKVLKLANQVEWDLEAHKSQVYKSLDRLFDNTDADVQTRVKSAEGIAKKAEKKKMTKNHRVIHHSVDDAFGYRMILHGDQVQEVSKVVGDIKEGVSSGQYKLLAVKNYHAKGVKPYLDEETFSDLNSLRSDKMLQQLEKAGYSTKSFQSFQGIDPKKKTGYTGLQMKLWDSRSREVIEIQVRGDRLHKVAEAEHLFYDFKQGKNIPNNLKSRFEKMNDQQKNDYEKYLSAQYKYARELELGQTSPKPEMPSSLKNFEGISIDELSNYIK